MKKKLKNSKFGKLISKITQSKPFKKVVNPLLDLAADALPFGTTVRKVLKGATSKIWSDENQDGKIQIEEINWAYIVGLVGIALLLRFEVVSKQDLLWAADVVLKLAAGN